MIIERHNIQRTGQRLQAPSLRLEKAKNNLWTASILGEDNHSIYLHSRYNPTSEAERFASVQCNGIAEDVPERIIVYGVGCGHHLEAIIKQTLSMGVAIEAWESNVSAFLEVEGAGVITQLVDEPRLTFVVSDNLQVFVNRMATWESNSIHIIIHEPSLRMVPEHLEPLKRVLQDYLIHQNSAIINRSLMQENFERNTMQNWPSVAAFNSMNTKPIILISAGPSLSKTMHLLPEASKHCLLGAVGTAAPLLFKNGVRPDFIVMTDPQPKMIEQLEHWESRDIPLFFLSTLYWEVVERYEGPKFIMFQEGYSPAEKMANFRGEPLLRTGGSVSTTLFSLARLLGLGPITLIGQDLAYTDNQTHVEGTHLFQKWEQQAVGERVLAYDRQGTVVAPRNLLLYKKWFEAQAEMYNETFYNSTGGGAYIEGFSHISLSEFIKIVHSIDVKEAREDFHRIAHELHQRNDLG